MFIPRRSALLAFAALMLLASLARGAVTLDFVVDLQATTSATVPHVRLSWTQRMQSNIASQRVHRRLKGGAVWVLQATLANTATSYSDPTALPGVEYEYWMERRFTGFNPDVAIGYLNAGMNVPAVENRGTLLLVVENSMTGPLAPEIAQLTEDLVGDGWAVQSIPVARTATPPSVRALIQAAYNANPLQVKAVYLLGRVPVPYSGLLAPDGHVPDHYGAWPADVYYGDVDGTWTDTYVNETGAGGTRQDNVPGDGKFDDTQLPSNIELQVGRVDLSSMTKAPTAAVTETALLRRYLRRAHAFRHRVGGYANVPRRSMIRDNFNYAFQSEPFAAHAWATAFSSVSKAVDQPGAGQWFTQATNNTYLWGEGNGGGGYESAANLGTSADFGTRSSRVVFTSLFGSYHGDWDVSNNFMRAVLAGNAQGDSLGLACFWGGRPQWFLHPCGMGESLGYAARLTQNNVGSAEGYVFTGNSPRSVHVALMGDPALRFHIVEPPRDLSATTASSQVVLTWTPSLETGVLGYHVFRAANPAGPFTRLTDAPLTTASFSDATATVGERATYMVRTLKRETSPGGTYHNFSQGVFATLLVNAAATGAPANPSGLVAQSVSSTQTVLTWSDRSADETGFRVERKLNAAGPFLNIGSVAANVTTFTDPGPLRNGSIYYYRVVAAGAGDSLPSNEVAVDGFAGFVEPQDARLKVSRASAFATITVNRLGGTTGVVNVTGATSDQSTVAGVHYSARNASLAFPDGSPGPLLVNVPILNTGQPQLPRQFRYSLSNPTGGAALGARTSTRVLIEDPAASVPLPWRQVMLGSVTDSSPAAFAENAFGSALIGGGVAMSDDGRFIYQPRTGDGVFTAYIDAPLPTQALARFALMIRAATASNAIMAGAMTFGDTTGTRLVSRAATGADVTLPGSSNSLLAPCWLRLTRSGNTFTAERSTNGATFINLATANVALPAAAQWGLFHASDASSGDFQLARFRHVAITAPGVLPTPENLTAVPAPPSQINLDWDPAGGTVFYLLERRALYGVFDRPRSIPANATSFADTAVQPGVIYEYRLQARSNSASSAYAALVAATAPGTATPYQQWLQANTLPMDGSGAGAPAASPAGDGIPNAMKYALGLIPSVPGYDARLVHATSDDAGKSYLSLTYMHPEPAPAAISYAVEVSPDLTAWSAASTVEMSNAVIGNTRTVNVRDTVPINPATPSRFLRLRVTLP